MPGFVPRRPSFRSSAASVPLFYLAGAFALLITLCLQTNGHFTYTLDDPYIHLALAERIRHGLYGLNAGTPVSPSSSILWPFLLVPFAGLRGFDLVPLVINFVCGTAVAGLFGWLLDCYLPDSDATREQRWLKFLTGGLLVLGTNCLGLTFIGLEHLLELLLCTACAVLIVMAVEDERIPGWLYIAPALLPLVRYEGLLVTGATAASLWLSGRRRPAFAALLCAVTPVLLFSLFLHHLGLPMLPVSVLAKAAPLAGGGSHVRHLVAVVLYAFRYAITDPERGAVLLVTVILLGVLIRLRTQWRLMLLLAPVLAVCIVQLLFGPYGWNYRYELYMLGFVVPILVAAFLGSWIPFQPVANSCAATTRCAPQLGLLAVALLPLAWVYSNGVLLAPNASRSIYRLDGQLARFSHEYYQGPIAIDDLGLVSYHRSPRQYVLDLASLGSYEVFRTPSKAKTKEWFRQIARLHGVGIVAVFPEWLPNQIPEQWHPAAKLCAVDTYAGPFSSRIMLYATEDANQQATIELLHLFQASLPTGTRLTISPENSNSVCE